VSVGERRALARPEQRRLSDPTEIAVTAGQLADAEAELEKGQASAAIVRTLQGEERVAHAKLETATQRLEQFEDIISRIDSARSQEGILTADLAIGNSPPAMLSRKPKPKRPASNNS
jgi:hypothetical protein